MSLTILKERILIGEATQGDVRVTLPVDAVILEVGWQNNAYVTFWFRTANPAMVTQRIFRVFGTGWEIPLLGYGYVGTCHANGYVWHLHEGIQR